MPLEVSIEVSILPKPLMMSRSAGLYARFFVPTDLRASIGSRYLVRSLGNRRGDHARLAAATMGVALSMAFDAMRKGMTVDLDELLKKVRSGDIQELTLRNVTLPDGTRIAQAQLDNPADAAMFGDLMERSRRVEPVEVTSARVAKRREQLRSASQGLANQASNALMLSKAMADHLRDLAGARLHQKTVLESRHTLRLFAGIIGKDVPVASLTQDHVRAFFEGVRYWPSNATKRPAYRDLSVPEVIKLAKKNQEPEPAAWTMAKHRQRLSVFLVSLVEGKHLAVNPLAGIRAISTPDSEDTGSPFTDAELKAIFDPVEFPKWASKYPHRWFGPILGLYSGARVNEIAQLRLEDIDTIDGVPGFFVRKIGKKQSIKNKHSRRFIPLAQPVIEAGFLTYVEEARQAGVERLFPDLPNSTGLGYGRQLSRQFSVYIKRQGVSEKGQGFHGFRHTIASKLDEAGVSASAIGALTGHGTGQTVLEKFYIDRRSLPDRVATLARFSTPIELPVYTNGTFLQKS
ncbi:site-specific integrase [Xanthomonas citri pv. glycines]|uniref:site-specific integrase n=1 Tax=Xanthomonas TaxID=338 RepID=UPI0002DF6496|nr:MULTISPECIES: site-specific integrase [Xanthomonas]AOY61959.1 integrase [Xanthomonas citri pv. glycines str. 8ra]ARV24374.1 integrase [Xanthomonas citri pv. glycines str. 12-2]QDR46420.1 site-specific integrase [Xanthomonas citri pv. glycines]QDS08413.1 site-specific integrase [Xanthomonas citri pv. glycines]QDS12758.1 site-specific integrase [Xanthomonas citri pv. glycines]